MRKKTTISNRKALLLSLAVFLFAIASFFLFSANSIFAQEATNKADDIERLEGMRADATKNNTYKDDSCNFMSSNFGKCLILIPFKLTRIIFEIAIDLFSIMIDTKHIKTILADNEAIYKAWAFVRDLLNMAFIMMLLFSAFCTIFQVEQYNYKKLLWKIVLMALLVNFSFPITRFIIDISNILMYSLIKADLFETTIATNGFAKIAASGSLQKVLTFTHATYPDAADLLAATVMVFMLSITFLAIGMLLLIRLIALALIIIFSPVAFAGSLVPFLSSQASKWWDNLFKYSFFGPIMILGIIISIGLLEKIGSALEATNSTNTFIGSLLALSIPIVLLWIVMGVAQSMSIVGAGAVMGAAQGAMKWAGKAPFKAGKFAIKKGAEATGIPGGLKQAWNKRVTQPLEQAKGRREAAVAGALGDKGAKERNLKARAAQYEKDGETDADLEKMAQKGDAAATLAMANKGTTTLSAYTGVMAKLDSVKDKNIIDLLDRKTREKKIDVIVDYKINKLGTGATAAQKTDVAVNELNKLDPDKWKDQDIESLLSTSANATTNVVAAQNVFSSFNAKNQDKATENMKGGKYAAGKGTVWP